MWESLKEIYLSVKKSSTERIRSPFYGVFILTWSAWNWKPLSILLFSDLKMKQRIELIDTSYDFKLLIPILVAAGLAYFLPIINEKVTYLQSKPISRTAVLIAVRRKKSLVADISVEKVRAKRDVTYDRSRTNAEKEIQDMREKILESQDNIESITGAKDKLQSELIETNKLLTKNTELAARFGDEAKEYKRLYEEEKARSDEIHEKIMAYEDHVRKKILENDLVAQMSLENERHRADLPPKS
ncbi:hypothetical protein Q5384_14500 [Enterobacter ludwigii]|uniref:hypothetical protein n=1 Tax=Enterobacter ludwigii TaxID=299767 RepID=UPI002B4BFF82|nr:hypothetical protein [Enterobacter ludwigii]WRM03042.1 hypothetical protein Q5384_14500 [Enterobacter ludwigii]